MKKTILILLLTIPFLGFGQCIEGDCENGFGTYLLEKTYYDNNDKPIVYKYKYIGEWENGKKDGMGMLINIDLPKDRYYGEWDEKFTMETLEDFMKLYYKKLRDGGTCIIFFDLWKLSHLKELMEKYKFKQLRFIEWIKTNPQPINSRVNYLTNSREIALLGVKKGKPTFNGEYDKGIYEFPIQGGKKRFHPTQKSIKLFEELIKKHSNEGDVIVDTFLGGGTTAIACKETGRKFIGSELDESYFKSLSDMKLGDE